MARARQSPWILVCIVLATLALAAPLWGPGMVNTRGGGDSPFLLQRTHQLVEALRSGVFPVRWMPDSAYGFGYPFYNYYSALPFYLAGTLVLIGLDVLAALRFVQTIGFVLSAVAMFGWVLRLTRRRWAALLAAVAYAAAPFHLVNVYVRGDSLSEFFAFAFYPLVLWGLDRMADSEATAWRVGSTSVPVSWSWIWPGLAYAGLIATHNISAFIFTPFVLLYLAAIILREKRKWRRLLVWGALALACGMLLSAWAWVPALAEVDLVQSQTLTDDYFHHSRHFRSADLVQRSMLFNYSVSPGRDSPFSMGLFQAVLGALGASALVLSLVRRRSRAADWMARPTGAPFLLAGLAVSTLMITPVLRIVWDSLPLLPLVQFPWRFLSVQALFVAASMAALVPKARRWAPVGLTIAALLVLSVMLPLHPDRLPVDPSDITTERLQLYELFTQNIGTTIRFEWLPRDAVPRPFTSDLLVEPGSAAQAISSAGGDTAATLVEQSPVAQQWRVSGDGGNVAFPVFYWPGWTATVDDERTAVWPAEGSGYTTLAVPPGDHSVELQLERTPVRQFSEAAAAVTLVLVATGILASRRRTRWRPAVALAGVVLVPSLVGLLLPTAVPTAGAGLTMDFDQMPFLHRNPGGIVFKHGPTLESYSLSGTEMAPGDRLRVGLKWSEVDDTYFASLRLVSPAATRHQTVPLSEVRGEVTGGYTDWTLRVPADAARGVYLVQLRVNGPKGEARALTTGGRTRGRLYLQPVYVARGPKLRADAPVIAPFGPAILLHSATIESGDSDHLDVSLGWSTRHRVPANYGISLRIVEVDGRVRQALDTQPGYGYSPTSMWRPGELVSDRYRMPLPPGSAECGTCSLHVILYQVASGGVIGETSLGPFGLPLEKPFAATSPPRSFDLPQVARRPEIVFGDEIELAGYEATHDAESVTLTLWWRAVQRPGSDYTVFVHLVDESSGDILLQSDLMPRAGGYPTSWWAAGEVVSDTVALPVDGLPAGDYQLVVGLYDQTVTRLRAVHGAGARLPEDALSLDHTIEVR